jgi:hypothetical protein
VPVEGVSAENTYIEQYVAYNFTSAPIISAKVTLTSTDMVNFSEWLDIIWTQQSSVVCSAAHEVR